MVERESAYYAPPQLRRGMPQRRSLQRQPSHSTLDYLVIRGQEQASSKDAAEEVDLLANAVDWSLGLSADPSPPEPETLRYTLRCALHKNAPKITMAAHFRRHGRMYQFRKRVLDGDDGDDIKGTSPEALATRSRLRYDDLVQLELNRWWDAVKGADAVSGSATMDRPLYTRLFRRIYRAMVPDDTEAEALEAINVEWERDAEGRPTIGEVRRASPVHPFHPSTRNPPPELGAPARAVLSSYLLPLPAAASRRQTPPAAASRSQPLPAAPKPLPSRVSFCAPRSGSDPRCALRVGRHVGGGAAGPPVCLLLAGTRPPHGPPPRPRRHMARHPRRLTPAAAAHAGCPQPSLAVSLHTAPTDPAHVARAATPPPPPPP
eukprot:187909-Prymnesium_polylepis.1